MQRALITGANGMLGANLARRLLREGTKVTAVTRNTSNCARLEDIQKEITRVNVDFNDSFGLRRCLDDAQPDVVYHLASTPFNPPIADPAEHYRVNVLGTLGLLEALRGVPKIKVIYTGTAAVYGSGPSAESETLEPSTVLGASKAAASMLLKTYARLYAVQTVELRLFMLYGPGEHPRRLVPQAILHALNGTDFAMSEGVQQRDFVFVDDVVEALVRAGQKTLPTGTVINIGSGTGTSIRDVVVLIWAITQARSRVLVGALPTRPDEIMVMTARIEKAKEELDWAPITALEQGIRKTIAWVSANRALLDVLGGSVAKMAA